MDKIKLRVSHIQFCFLYITLLYVIFNALDIDQIARWFYLGKKIDYVSLGAFLIIGLCASIAVFTLLAHRWTIKPLAITWVILGGAAAYFASKYGVVIDHSMVMNVLHTDPTEARGLLSVQMIPYVLLLIILPILAISSVQITFESTSRYLFASLKLFLAALTIGVILLYANFDGIQRAGNISRKYIVQALIPINFLQSFGSIVQDAISPYYADHIRRKTDVTGHITTQDNLVVVLAIGESSRQQNFSIYGYKRQNTNPVLSKFASLHLLNGIARIGSTLYALPEILVKRDVSLPAITSKLGINTSCYVSFTLYDNCDPVGEVKATNCGHGGNCYDEDVIPLLSENLKTYTSGYRLIILHLGGGSHGPIYRDRYPPEFQRFKPMCLDADVVNQCSAEELYNSYDNSILYVDNVVGKAIDALDESNAPYVFMYLSDHGESLMENGHIFHGMPPGVPLPPEQSHIPLIVKSSVPISIVKREEYGQQDVYDTILGLFSIETDIRDKDKNFILRQK